MRILTILGAALLALAAVLAFNTLRLSPAPKSPPATDLVEVDAAAAAERLAAALRIPTVTVEARDQVDWAQWPRLHRHLQQSFPRVHETLARETVSDHSLLYTWSGSDPDVAPILLLAHQDVVPVPPDSLNDWAEPPFDGTIAGDYVWGRGAIDDKASLVAQLEAVELLLAQGFRPRRTVYFAFGHDEEIAGLGAAAIADLLERRGITAKFALDEGGVITQGVVSGVTVPVASIMTGEKGYLSLELTARGEPGHSSRPPTWTAVGRLARAITRLQEHPFPPELTPPVAAMLDRLAPHMGLGGRFVVANRWLLEPLLLSSMARSDVTRAIVHTTTAPTMLRAGVKENILPDRATATVNFRILPGRTRDSVEARMRSVIDDPAIEISRLEFGSDPSGGAENGAGPGFALLERTVNEVFPEAVVTPGIVIGATDIRHYSGVFRARYNFLPLTLGPGDLSRFHGTNERIPVHDYVRMVQFYARLLRNAAGPEP